MLVEESIWIKNIIKGHFGTNNFPILNIGSSTLNFRKNVQPHIYENIFLPLEEQTMKVIHLDMKMDEGVDIIGDLSDVGFRNSLKSKGIKSVLCSNLLEHLSEPQSICTSILDLLEKGDLIIVTVPYKFPYHKDPIDTYLRPTPEELHLYFKNTEIIESAIVESNGSYYKDLIANKKYLMIMLCRLIMPFYKPQEWGLIVRDFIKAKRKYSATCLLLKKQ